MVKHDIAIDYEKKDSRSQQTLFRSTIETRSNSINIRLSDQNMIIIEAPKFVCNKNSILILDSGPSIKQKISFR